jgi:hypothetical protein
MLFDYFLSHCCIDFSLNIQLKHDKVQTQAGSLSVFIHVIDIELSRHAPADM